MPPGSDGLLRAGASRAPITPPVGFAIHSPESPPARSTRIDDDLLVRVLLLEAEGRRVAICSLDVWGIAPGLQREIRESVASMAGTHAPFVWITCSGNGTSPPTWQEDGDPEYDRYLSFLPEICGGAAAHASSSMQPAAIGGNAGRVTGVSTGVSGPGAQADEAVNVCSVTSASGEGLAQIVSFSCPAVIRGPDGRWTADYAGYAAWALEQAGGGVVAFARGSDADVMPYDWHRGNQDRTHADRGPQDVQALGLLLATQASTIASSIEYRRNVSIETASDDALGVRILRVGGVVCIGVDRPQPAVFARHLRRAMPRSTVIVSSNISGMDPASGEELDVDLELSILERARTAGAR